MKKIETTQRATSQMPFFLYAFGLFFMIGGFLGFATPQDDHTSSVIALAAGFLLWALASLRSAVLDLVYEQRLTRAAVESATSNHAAPAPLSPSER